MLLTVFWVLNNIFTAFPRSFRRAHKLKNWLEKSLSCFCTLLRTIWSIIMETISVVKCFLFICSNGGEQILVFCIEPSIALLFIALWFCYFGDYLNKLRIIRSYGSAVACACLANARPGLWSLSAALKWRLWPWRKLKMKEDGSSITSEVQRPDVFDSCYLCTNWALNGIQAHNVTS